MNMININIWKIAEAFTLTQAAVDKHTQDNELPDTAFFLNFKLVAKE